MFFFKWLLERGLRNTELRGRATKLQFFRARNRAHSVPHRLLRLSRITSISSRSPYCTLVCTRFVRSSEKHVLFCCLTNRANRPGGNRCFADEGTQCMSPDCIRVQFVNKHGKVKLVTGQGLFGAGETQQIAANLPPHWSRSLSWIAFVCYEKFIRESEATIRAC